MLLKVRWMAIALLAALAQVLSIFVLHIFGRVVFVLKLDVSFEVELDTEALPTFFT